MKKEYSPYKMKGHTLPGIKQTKKSPTKFWQALIPIAAQAVSGMMKKKEEK